MYLLRTDSENPMITSRIVFGLGREYFDRLSELCKGALISVCNVQ